MRMADEDLSPTEVRRRAQRLPCERVHPELTQVHPQGHPPFTCPDCAMTSMHPEDLRQGYCGNCQAFTGIGLLVELGLPRTTLRPTLRRLPPAG